MLDQARTCAQFEVCPSKLVAKLCYLLIAENSVQGATVALMAGTAGVASLGASDEAAPPAPQSKRKNQPDMQSEMQSEMQ